MNMKGRKTLAERLLPLLICISMIAQLLPMTVKAAESDVKLTVVTDKAVAAPGDTVNVTLRLTGTDSLGEIDGSVIRAVGSVLNYDSNNFTAPISAGDYKTGDVIRGSENTISSFESYVVPYDSTKRKVMVWRHDVTR